MEIETRTELKEMDKKLQNQLNSGPFPYVSKNMSVRENKLTKERVIFVSNISNLVEKKKILKYFKKFGKISKIWLNKNKDQSDQKNNQIQNLFILYRNKESVQKAVLDNNKLFEKRHLLIKEAENFEIDARTIFISGLKENQDEEFLYNYFSDCGEIINLYLIRDGLTLKSKGYSYISFKKKISVFNAIQKKNDIFQIQKAGNQKKVEKKVIKIKYDRPTKMSEAESKIFTEELQKLKNTQNPENQGYTENLYNNMFKHSGVVPQSMIRKALKKLYKKNVTGIELTKASNRIRNKAHSKIKREVFDKDDLLKVRREAIKRKKRIFKSLARKQFKQPKKKL